MNNTLYVCCGVPGSGKSTFLEEMKGSEEKIISRDKIRFSLLRPGEDYFAREKEVYSKFLNEITKNIRAGFNVYADATHLNEKSRYKLLHGLHNRGCNPSEIIAIYFDVPLEVCKERNNFRLGTKTYVPEEQVLKMYNAYTHPHKYEGFTNIYRIDEDGYVEKEE